jgi:carbamoyltransferase
VQTVDILGNKRFYSLIKEFNNQTNIPIILNTSFNENEPIVQTPDQAISCFLRTNMDVLVLENWVISRV